MSRGIKVLWIVIGSIFVVGAILTAIGITLGGSGSLWLGRDGIHFGPQEQNATEFADTDSEPFSNIDVELIEADVEIVTGSAYGYTFTYTGNQDPSVEIAGGTLKVKENFDVWPIRILGLWDLHTSEAKLTVYVPEEASLDQVTLYTASGETVLTSNQISIEHLDCKSASGDVVLAGLQLGSLSLDVASGDVSLSEVKASSAYLNLMSGWLNYEGAELESLDLNMASGHAAITGEITSHIKVQMASGDIDLNLKGNEDDYRYEVNRVSGDIRVNGRSVSESSWPSSSSSGSGSALGLVEINTTSGSVNLNFS